MESFPQCCYLSVGLSLSLAISLSLSTCARTVQNSRCIPSALRPVRQGKKWENFEGSEVCVPFVCFRNWTENCIIMSFRCDPTHIIAPQGVLGWGGASVSALRVQFFWSGWRGHRAIIVSWLTGRNVSAYQIHLTGCWRFFLFARPLTHPLVWLNHSTICRYCYGLFVKWKHFPYNGIIRCGEHIGKVFIYR